MFTRRQLFFNHLAQTSNSSPAFEFYRAEGCYLFDETGRKFLDIISGISVSNLGHGNEEIRKAIHKQVDEHLHLMVYGEYIIASQVDLVSNLTNKLPPSLQSVFLTNSGTEATEGAMKLAKRFTGRTGFISMRNSYHGSTQGALSISGNEQLKNAYRPLLPDHTIIDLNNLQQLNFINDSTAAVFIEPIMAEAGIIFPEKEFLEKLRKKCNEHQVILVFDEIQTGMGRTGHLFAFDDMNIVPDILLLGKAFGGGMPLGAFIASKEIMSKLSYDPALGHLTTTGGHPVSCAAALASLIILTTTDLLASVKKKELILKSMLKHPAFKSVRGKGLFFAIEFENELINQKVIKCCYENGLLSDWFLFSPSCMRIAPPLTITEVELNMACEIILKAVNKSI